jgi:hypothetical protein
MNGMGKWKHCDYHDSGPEPDETVSWRDLGLMCEACYEAYGDRRPLQAEIERLQAALKEIASADRGVGKGRYDLIEIAVQALKTQPAEIDNAG